MPVLPEVASISVSPGLMSPRFSASHDHRDAGRSFTDPAGLLPSSLASTTLVVSPGMRCRRTSGVLPMVDSSVGYILRMWYVRTVHCNPRTWSLRLRSARSRAPRKRDATRYFAGLASAAAGPRPSPRTRRTRIGLGRRCGRDLGLRRRRRDREISARSFSRRLAPMPLTFLRSSTDLNGPLSLR